MARHVATKKPLGFGPSQGEPDYIITSGNIMTPVVAYENAIFGTPPAPTMRGRNDPPGEHPFPTSVGAKTNSTPLSAFGLRSGEKK